jgi:hypothetical protein
MLLLRGWGRHYYIDFWGRAALKHVFITWLCLSLMWLSKCLVWIQVRIINFCFCLGNFKVCISCMKNKDLMLFFCLFEIQIGLVLIMCFIGAKNACYKGQMHGFWVFGMSVFFMIMCPQCIVDEHGFKY